MASSARIVRLVVRRSSSIRSSVVKLSPLRRIVPVLTQEVQATSYQEEVSDGSTRIRPPCRQWNGGGRPCRNAGIGPGSTKARARQNQRGGVIESEISRRHPAWRRRRHAQGDGCVRRQQYLWQHALGKARREVVGRCADQAPRARGVVRHQARHDADHHDLRVDRPRTNAGDLPGRTRSRQEH